MNQGTKKGVNKMEKMTLREFAEYQGYEIKDESSLDQEYRDYIDEFNSVEIMGMSYTASRVLEELDPTAYRCCFNDWLDGEEWDEWEGDYMKRDDIQRLNEEYQEYLEELENEE